MQTYSVGVNLNWRTAPSGKTRFVGELTISFTCDPGSSPRLVDMALTEFDQLQVISLLFPSFSLATCYMTLPFGLDFEEERQSS